MSRPPPSTILIIGGGVFGLSTAYHLSHDARYKDTSITLLDRPAGVSGNSSTSSDSFDIPPPDIASIDTSRIVRDDYADPIYCSLAQRALARWRDTEWGADGRYTQSGLLLVGDRGDESYVVQSLANVRGLPSSNPSLITNLPSREAIAQELAPYAGTSGVSGYLNRGSGWGNAAAVNIWLRRKLLSEGRVSCVTGTVERLLLTDDNNFHRRCVGCVLTDGTRMRAGLTVLATGAWTGSLIDLRGIAKATGHVLGYIELTEEEQEKYGGVPTVLNMSTGVYIISPSQRLLKVARHAYGYSNPTVITSAETGEATSVSSPRTDTPIPLEGDLALRAALRQTIPHLGDRPWTKTRVCWYSDTPAGDFVLDHHPRHPGLFVATGDSGHGFKFAPVLGECVADAIVGELREDLRGKWAWPGESEVHPEKEVWTEDGSRSGRRGMVLREELGRERVDDDRGGKL